MSSNVAPNSSRNRATRALAAAGLGLAVIAELSSTGLLGLSGWFISACAIAGAAAFSSFSYLAPSGGVRAFALSRIGGNYSKRLVLHAAALRQVTAARADFFQTVAASNRPQLAGVWSGALLDRTMADADSIGMALIQSTAPATVALAMSAGGVFALALANSLTGAAVLAIGVALTAVIAYRSPDTTAGPTEQRPRSALRAELVTAVDAWAEMASLGAAAQLATRTTASLAEVDAAREAVSRRRLRTALVTGLVSVATLAATMACAISSGADPAVLVFVALITTGVMGGAEQLGFAAETRVSSAAARDRLTISAPPSASTAADSAAMRSWATDQTIGLDGYLLPAMVLRPQRVLSACVARGGTLVVAGRSGSGKSTLLRALASSLKVSLETDHGRPAVTYVEADDYLFTGTLESNFRLADPTMTDHDVNERLAALWLDRSGLTASTPVGPGGRPLSGGELRRVGLGRALATRPQVLVVDEPTNGLDEQTAQHVLHTLAHLPDTTVVVALHTMPAHLASAGNVSVLLLD